MVVSESCCFKTNAPVRKGNTLYLKWNSKECLTQAGQEVTFEKPSCLHMCNAELLLFARIGSLRKQHEQISGYWGWSRNPKI